MSSIVSKMNRGAKLRLESVLVEAAMSRLTKRANIFNLAQEVHGGLKGRSEGANAGSTLFVGEQACSATIGFPL